MPLISLQQAQEQQRQQLEEGLQDAEGNVSSTIDTIKPPEGWELVWDHASQHHYYYHSETGTSQWDRPDS